MRAGRLDFAPNAVQISSMAPDSTTWIAIAEIVWINVLLSGDNAVVIALACRSLPPEKRHTGIVLGAGAAVGLRIIFTALVASLLNLPFLKIVGGLLLISIAIKLLIEESDENEVAQSTDLWGAVGAIALADMVMSLDNVLAIAAAARGSLALIVFGLLLSAPLIVFSASMMSGLLRRFPILVWGGAGLLGWVAGELLTSDPAWTHFAGWTPDETWVTAAQALVAIFVVAIGWAAQKWRRERQRI